MNNRPEWLQPSRSIYSKQYGTIQISTIIGENLYFRKGNISQVIFNWREEIEQGNLSPVQNALSPRSLIYQQIASELEGRNKLAHCDIIPEQAANYQPIPENVHPAVSKALAQLGINQLYSHQIQAWEAYNQSSDIILETPTSSGKSISFLLPVIHECLKGNSCIIFFNLKALAFDQEEKIFEVISYHHLLKKKGREGAMVMCRVTKAINKFPEFPTFPYDANCTLGTYQVENALSQRLA